MTGGVHDPLENVNRRVHEANKALDRAVLRPASQGYSVINPDLRRGVSNFAENLAMPSVVANDVLQGHLGDALHNSARFLINSILGLGLMDPATGAGLEARPSDFGQTLHSWGMTEGAYLEIPVLGPSTVRDATGTVVDLVLNPMAHILPADAQWLLPAGFVATTLNDRAEFGDTVDSVLYESADSYAQTRLFYLDSRRHYLGAEQGAEDELYGIYEEAFE